MIHSFDRIVIAVPELEAAVSEYQTLLGAIFWLVPGNNSQPRAWLGLANVTLELRQQAVAQPTIIALVFAGDAPPDTSIDVANALELPLSICDGVDTASFRQAQGESQNPSLSVDHIVLRTADADACIDLFSVGLGIRLALDKNAPQWGARMLFFRVGKLTLEVVEPAGEKPERDHFWGIAYQCSDLSSTTQKLLERGVALSEARIGRKPGTKVATVKSHSLTIPTLLVEPAV